MYIFLDTDQYKYISECIAHGLSNFPPNSELDFYQAMFCIDKNEFGEYISIFSEKDIEE
jgi:hypothetical protein